MNRSPQLGQSEGRLMNKVGEFLNKHAMVLRWWESINGKLVLTTELKT